MNPMREIKLEKVSINLGAGEAGPKLEKSQKILEKITGNKVIVTKTHKRTTFGGAKKRPIGVMTTLRNEQARELYSRAMVFTIPIIGAYSGCRVDSFPLINCTSVAATLMNASRLLKVSVKDLIKKKIL